MLDCDWDRFRLPDRISTAFQDLERTCEMLRRLPLYDRLEFSSLPGRIKVRPHGLAVLPRKRARHSFIHRRSMKRKERASGRAAATSLARVSTSLSRRETVRISAASIPCQVSRPAAFEFGADLF